MATHSSDAAWEIPWTEEPGRLQCMGSQGSRTQQSDSHFLSPIHIRESHRVRDSEVGITEPR